MGRYCTGRSERVVAHPVPSELDRLFRTGFVANNVPLWGGTQLAGFEVAIVSETYPHLLNTQPGLKSVALSAPPGKVVAATVVTAPTPAAEIFLNCCHHLTLLFLSAILPQDLFRAAASGTDFPRLRWAKLSPKRKSLAFATGEKLWV